MYGGIVLSLSGQLLPRLRLNFHPSFKYSNVHLYVKTWSQLIRQTSCQHRPPAVRLVQQGKVILGSMCIWTCWRYASSFNVYCIPSQVGVAAEKLHPSIDAQSMEHAFDNDSVVQRAKTILRIIYLIFLFSPALILHISNLFLPFKFIHKFKWYFIRFAIQQAGPSFIKLGQWASTRRDIFSEDVCSCLSKLQRHCYIHSWRATRKALEENFGPDWEKIFTRVDPNPIGSGCVAQVYRWDIKPEYAPSIANDNEHQSNQGTKINTHSLSVAVKVLHPGIVGSVLRDIQLMRLVARMIDNVYPKVFWISLRECVEEFGIVMKKQVNIMLYLYTCTCIIYMHIIYVHVLYTCT